jgi:IclR family acetate operon transcriptional repressor
MVPGIREPLAYLPYRGNLGDEMATVQSVERAMSLLREVGRAPGGLVDLAERVDLPTTTTARLLATLENEEAVRRDDDGTYLIGPAIDSLVRSASPGDSIHAAAEWHMIDLAAELDEAVCLSIPVGRDVVTTHQIDAPKPVQAEDWTGTRVPMHAGCAGIVVMATWSDPEVEAYLADDLEVFTPQTVVDADALRDRVAEVRRTRVMWTHGEYVEELSSVGAAITGGGGRAVGALYTYGPSYRYPSSGGADLIAAMVLARATDISAALAREAVGEDEVAAS